MTTLLTTLSRLITENTEIREIKAHENTSQRPNRRGNHSGTWSGNNLNVFGKSGHRLTPQKRQSLASSEIPS